jgi:DMSO/TMAO reductase YedYZ heme-binding membrane subunit
MQEPTIKEVLNTNTTQYRILFFSLIFYIVASSLYVSNVGAVMENDPQMSYIVTMILTFLILILAPVSYLVPQKQIARIDPLALLADKLVLYRKAMFLRYLAMNLAGLFIAIGFAATANTNLILGLAIILLFFIIFKPSPFKIALDLALGDEEKQKLMQL